MKAADQLAAEGIRAAVVSAPCLELFATQPASYRTKVLGKAPRIAVEAGVEQGWGKYLGDRDLFIGMTGFGASAPADELFEHFGINAEAVVKAAKSLLA